MDNQKLDKANNLRQSIKELDYFIDSIERIGNCSTIFFKREPRFFVKRIALPWVEENVYELDKTTEERILSVLRARLIEQEAELERL